jgi:hypothetical protein
VPTPLPRSRVRVARFRAALTFGLLAATAPMAAACAPSVASGPRGARQGAAHAQAAHTPFRCAALHLSTEAGPVTASVHLGDVRATFTATELKPVRPGSDGYMEDAQIEVVSPGAAGRRVQLDNVPLDSVVLGDGPRFYDPSSIATPGSSPWSTQPICIATLGPSGGTAVLVGSYSGGSQCCSTITAYPVSRHGIGGAVVTPFANLGPVTIERDGTYAMLVTADIDFAMSLGPYMFTQAPVMVLGFKGSRFVVATRQHRRLVLADAKTWWDGYLASVRQGPSGGPDAGYLAAWLADECVLGTSAAAWGTIGKLFKEGKFETDGAGWPNGASYLSRLRAVFVVCQLEGTT